MSAAEELGGQGPGGQSKVTSESLQLRVERSGACMGSGQDGRCRMNPLSLKPAEGQTGQRDMGCIGEPGPDRGRK